MFICTDKAKIDAIYSAKSPRPMRDVILETYPEATIDCNNRAHAPYDGYECSLTGRTFKAGEYLPGMENEDGDSGKFHSTMRTVSAAVEGDVVQWHGSKAQISAVCDELRAQSTAYDALFSNHIGAVGEKLAISATIQGRFRFEGSFGFVYVYILKDDAKNVIVYKGSVDLMLWNIPKYNQRNVINAYGNLTIPVKGVKLQLAAKIKAHGERDGVKQTQIERVKVLGVAQ